MAKKQAPKQAELAEAQGTRLAYSWKELTEVKKRGAKYERYIHGDPPPLVGDNARADSSKLTEAQREARALGKGWIVVTRPYHGETRAAIISSLVSKGATWVDVQRVAPDDADEAVKRDIDVENGFNRVCRELAKVIDKQSRTKQQLRSAVDDALQYSQGWLYIDFDAETTLARIRWTSTLRVMVDLEPDCDPFGDMQQWRALCSAWPIDKAEYMLREQWGKGEEAWVKKGHEFTPAADDYETEDGTREKMPTEYTRLVHVYVRGANPYTNVADLGVDADDVVEDAGDDPVYEGRDECLVFEATGQMDEPGGYILIARYPYPFPCDFPLEPLALTDDNSGFYKPPFYQMSHSLVLAANSALRNYATKTFQMTRMTIGYDPSKFNKDSFRKTFFGPDAANLVEFKGGDMTRAFQAMQMGEVPKDLKEAIGAFDGFVSEVSGQDVYEIEQRSHQPATNAALQDAQKQLRLDEMADRVEVAYERAMTKALMACCKLMTAEDVAKHIGDEFMGWYDDNGVRKAKYWPDEKLIDNEAIRTMVDLHIEPRSVRFASPQQELEDLQMYAGKVTEYAAQVQQANEVNPTVAAELARVFNATLDELATKLRLTRRNDLKFDLMKIATPPIPQGPAPMQSASTTVGADGSQTVEASAPAGTPMDGPLGFMKQLQGQGMTVDPAMQQLRQAMMEGGGEQGPT